MPRIETHAIVECLHIMFFDEYDTGIIGKEMIRKVRDREKVTRQIFYQLALGKNVQESDCTLKAWELSISAFVYSW